MDINASTGRIISPGGTRTVPAPAPGSRAPAHAAVPDPPPVVDRVDIAFEGRVPATEGTQAPLSTAASRGGTRVHRDEATSQFVFEILNREREVIKQFPPEEALRIAARFRELTGLLFDESI